MASVQYDDSAFYLLVLALLCMYLVPGVHLSDPFVQTRQRATVWQLPVRAAVCTDSAD